MNIERDQNFVSNVARWVIKHFLSSRAKKLLPLNVYDFLYKHIIMGLVRTYSYSDYLDYQLKNSAWTREIEESQYGLSVAAKYLSSWFTSHTVFLDLGCGDGYMLDLIKSQVKYAVGIDYHFGKLSTSLQHGNSNVRGDMHCLPFKNQVFDVIHTSHVIEHSISPEVALQEIKRVIKPGGKILIVVPAGGLTTIKHPNVYKDKHEIQKRIGKYFEITDIWQDSTREPEFWITAVRP